MFLQILYQVFDTKKKKSRSTLVPFTQAYLLYKYFINYKILITNVNISRKIMFYILINVYN